MFGSRITSKAKRFSDVDLFYKDAIPGTVITKLEAELEESDLPYKVDIITMMRLSGRSWTRPSPCLSKHYRDSGAAVSY